MIALLQVLLKLLLLERILTWWFPWTLINVLVMHDLIISVSLAWWDWALNKAFLNVILIVRLLLLHLVLWVRGVVHRIGTLVYHLAVTT